MPLATQIDPPRFREPSHCDHEPLRRSSSNRKRTCRSSKDHGWSPDRLRNDLFDHYGKEGDAFASLPRRLTNNISFRKATEMAWKICCCSTCCHVFRVLMDISDPVLVGLRDVSVLQNSTKDVERVVLFNCSSNPTSVLCKTARFDSAHLIRAKRSSCRFASKLLSL